MIDCMKIENYFAEKKRMIKRFSVTRSIIISLNEKQYTFRNLKKSGKSGE